VKDEKIFEKIKHFKNEIEDLKEIFIIYGESKNSLKALEEAEKKNPVKSYKPHWSEPAELIYLYFRNYRRTQGRPSFSWQPVRMLSSRLSHLS